MPLGNVPFRDAKFSLDTIAVAGFFGGEEVIAAMLTVHLYEGRKWLGWYNSPGSYTVAKRYGQMAKSRLWDGLFPGPNLDPATVFQFAGEKGPKFVAAFSGTVMDKTSYIAHLLAEECKGGEDRDIRKIELEDKTRRTTPTRVTVIHLPPAQDWQGNVKDKKLPLNLLETHSVWLAVFPIFISLCSTAACGLFEDWYSFSLILLGILSSGITCLVIGSGKLNLDYINSAEGSPPGDGMMKYDGNVVILKGTEHSVAAITRGEFRLEFTGGKATGRSVPTYRNIGRCSVLLVAQFLLQLLLVPQGTLFGQTMFIVSLASSWAYNAYLSSIDKTMTQRDILRKIGQRVLPMEENMRRYELPTWTSTTVFVLLAMKPSDPRKILQELIPNDTEVWKVWKNAVVERMTKQQNDSASESAEAWSFSEPAHGWASDLKPEDIKLLRTLFADTKAAFDGYRRCYDLDAASAGLEQPQLEASGNSETQLCDMEDRDRDAFRTTSSWFQIRVTASRWLGYTSLKRVALKEGSEQLV